MNSLHCSPAPLANYSNLFVHVNKVYQGVFTIEVAVWPSPYHLKHQKFTADLLYTVSMIYEVFYIKR